MAGRLFRHRHHRLALLGCREPVRQHPPDGFTVEGVVQDTWFNDIIPLGNFQASLHWTDGGSTPWNMYSNIMDGASYVPLGQPATWNFGRYQNEAVTQALADFKLPAKFAAYQMNGAQENVPKIYAELGK